MVSGVDWKDVGLFWWSYWMEFSSYFYTYLQEGLSLTWRKLIMTDVGEDKKRKCGKWGKRWKGKCEEGVKTGITKWKPTFQSTPIPYHPDQHLARDEKEAAFPFQYAKYKSFPQKFLAKILWMRWKFIFFMLFMYFYKKKLCSPFYEQIIKKLKLNWIFLEKCLCFILEFLFFSVFFYVVFFSFKKCLVS